MKKIVNSIGIVALLLISAAVHAQKGNVKADVNYNYSLPMGNFKNNIISNGSPRGGNVSIMYSLSNKLALGGVVGYQDYYQKYPRAVYQTGDHESTSAVLSNSLQSTPLMAKLAYTPLGSSASPIQPYISAGAGFSFVSFKQYLGEFGGTDNSISFAAQAGAGVLIPFGKLSQAGVRLGADYSYLPYNKNNMGNLTSLDLHAGVYFPLR